MGDHLTVDYDSDEEYTDYATDAPLPTPTPTPFRTPHPSRHHSRHATPSPTPSGYSASGSPPATNGGRASPLHRINTGHQQHSHHHQLAFDETISILDPRRFTPTLHANLVAEILSLRRELEAKSNWVNTLEEDLHEARNEHETAATTAVTAQREARDIKRQLARAENDDAVEIVAKERDEAVNTVAELKRQVERLTKSRRAAEEDVERMKKEAEQEREEFEAIKRALERKVHVAEGRLKSVLDEVAATNSLPPPQPPPPEIIEDHEDANQSEIEQSDAASIQENMRDSFIGRPTSWKMGDDEAERLGIRFSVAPNAGKSLADELNFDDDEDDEEGLEEYDEYDEDDRTADFSFAEDTALSANGSDNGLQSAVEENDQEEENEMTAYHEMGVQVDIDDTQEIQEQESKEEQQQLHQESEKQVERLDILGLEIEEKLAELERTYVELDRKTQELDSIYNEVDRAHYRIVELEEQVDKMDEEAAEREEFISNLRRDHMEEIKVFEARGKEVEEKWAALQTQGISLEKTIEERSKSLDEREALIIAASTPIVVEGEPTEMSLEQRSKELDDRQVVINVQKASLDEREKLFEEQKLSLEKRETYITEQEAAIIKKGDNIIQRESTVIEQQTTITQQMQNLVDQKKTLDERESNLNDQKAAFEQKDADLVEWESKLDTQKVAIEAQKTIIAERENSLDERNAALDLQRTTLEEQKVVFEEQKSTLEEQKTALEEQKAALEARVTSLDEREEELDEREAELDDQVTTVLERKSNLDRRELSLNERHDALQEWEGNLNEAEINLEEREKAFAEREALGVSSPISIDDKAKTEAEIEGKERDGEYEANERRKRRSTGVSLMTLSSPVANIPTPMYVSCESQTTPSYTSVKSQTSPPYVSVETQVSPAYASTETQARPEYVSVDAQASPLYVSVDAQASPIYISVEAQTGSPYVSVEIQTNPPYVSTEAQTSSSYVSTECQASWEYVSVEAQTSSDYVSTETQCNSEYVSVDMQTASSQCISAESQVTPMYATTESQTEELIPPPIPPRRGSPVPPMSPISPAVEMQTIGVQTEPMRPPPLARVIPTIAVIPPPPTPPLPPPPPPVMKSASAQTIAKPRTRSRSMQTEEIRLDERLMKIAPHLHPSAIMASHPPVRPVQLEDIPPSPPKKSSRRSMVKRSSTMGPISVTTSGTTPRSVPMVDSGHGSAFFSSPPRSDTFMQSPDKALSRRSFGYPDVPGSSGDEFLDDGELSVNEFKTALSAPKSKKPKSTPHVNLNKPSPVETSVPKPGGGLQRKGATIRKTALISSGSQAHNRPRSPSFESNRTSESGGTKIGPPFPVPARHSSRKPGGYGSHPRNESPTPMPIGFSRRPTQPRHQRESSVQSIRKVRSATALPSLRTSNGRNRSPPPLSASSIAPDSPMLPFRRDEIRASAFERPKHGSIKHKRVESITTSTSATTNGNASVGSTIQQTSVVDAIAQTMVGEWMWKYVRRRKSFGVAESPQNDDSAGGQRHKRWVWLAPYERAVMWSSRQPTSGNALLGKSGRKRKPSILQSPAGLNRALDKVLTSKVPIQSVLDVKDETPLPKGADLSKPLFNRSILILTPARALKFTAPNKERHYVWLTALSFLSHSPQGSEGLLALPPPMPFEYEQLQHQQPSVPTRPPVPPIPMHRDAPFHPVRDSIRLAKGKSRQKAAKINGFPPRNDSILEVESIRSVGSSTAEPPSIPRFPGQHTRKRSSSAVRPGTHRSISNGYDPAMLSSFGGSNTADYYGAPLMGVGGIGIVTGNSLLSGHPNPPLGNWDNGPVGTVRMEAFVERPRYDFDDEEEYGSRFRRDRRSSRQSHWSGSVDYAGSPGLGPASNDEGFWRGEDPFSGF